MQPADIVILAVIAYSTWCGLRRGLVREAFALAGWVLGILMAIRSHENIAPALAPLIDTPSLRLAAAFLLVCLGVVFLVWCLGHVLRSLLKALAMGPADRLMGAGFGAARGALIVVVIVGVLHPWVKDDPWWREAALPSAVYPYFPVVRQWTQEVREEAKHLPAIHVPKASPDHH